MKKKLGLRERERAEGRLGLKACEDPEKDDFSGRETPVYICVCVCVCMYVHTEVLGKGLSRGKKLE